MAVAFSIVHLLPVELLVSVGSGAGMAMILSLLIAAILWNLGTWWLGLPASSSHTLIGAILGVGLANSTLPGHRFGSGVDWTKAGEVGLSLLVSPVVGFAGAAGLYSLIKTLGPADVDRSPQGDEPPPRWTRLTLIATCTGVSVAHGSNDGQKGIGLIMLILIGILPTHYALDPAYDAARARRTIRASESVTKILSRRDAISGETADSPRPRLLRELADLRETLDDADRPRDLSRRDRWEVRSDLLRIDRGLEELEGASSPIHLTDSERKHVDACRTSLRGATDYAPTWVRLAVALALGLGTMVGWKRIVTTVGEKIGKAHLGYAQGAAAEVVAMLTIGLADAGGLPVSTTHVVSSGVAGTMAARGSGVQMRTIRNIALAWIFTLPASMLLAGGLFLVLRRVMM
jgi:PiT family inorganic phosphate transporter